MQLFCRAAISSHWFRMLSFLNEPYYLPNTINKWISYIRIKAFIIFNNIGYSKTLKGGINNFLHDNILCILLLQFNNFVITCAVDVKTFLCLLLLWRCLLEWNLNQWYDFISNRWKILKVFKKPVWNLSLIFRMAVAAKRFRFKERINEVIFSQGFDFITTFAFITLPAIKKQCAKIVSCTQSHWSNFFPPKNLFANWS